MGTTIAFFIAFVFMGISANAMSETRNSDDSPIRNQIFETMQDAFGQKVFLHTDKTEYLVQETIWFKAYLLNASDDRLDNRSQSLYMDLIDTRGRSVVQKIMPFSSGLLQGDIVLPDSLPSGNYLLRAYTPWMRNFSSDFFFYQNLEIFNPEEANFISRAAIRYNNEFNNELAHNASVRNFAFYPEGGSLVCGIENRLAFKAYNDLGQGVSASGIILDESGNQVAVFETEAHGMGKLAFLPELGKSYKALVEFDSGASMEFPVPESAPTSLKVSEMPGSLDVEIRTNGGLLEELPLVIMAYVGGQVVYLEEFMLEGGDHRFTIDTGALPSGICNIVLFSAKGAPLNERMVFIEPASRGRGLEVDTYMDRIDGMDVLTIDVFFDSSPDRTSYSMSVLHLPPGSEEIGVDMATFLLLDHELGGSFSRNMQLFSLSRQERQQIISLTLMTSQQKRLQWDELLTGNPRGLAYNFSKGVGVSGRVEALSSAQSLDGTPVELVFFENSNERYLTQTNRDGRFVFEDLEFFGVKMANLSLPTQSNTGNLWLIPDPPDFMESNYIMGSSTRVHNVLEQGNAWTRVTEPVTWIHHETISKPEQERHYSGRSDQVLYGHDLEDQYANMEQMLLARVRGLEVRQNQITFRGQFANRLEPLFFVDGNQASLSEFLSFNIKEMDRLEVIRGGNAAIFGARGGNGALIVYSRIGVDSGTRSFQHMVQGWDESRSFEPLRGTGGYGSPPPFPKTLYWEPNLQPGPDGVFEFAIEVPREAGVMVVYINGIDANGHPVHRWVMAP